MTGEGKNSCRMLTKIETRFRSCGPFCPCATDAGDGHVPLEIRLVKTRMTGFFRGPHAAKGEAGHLLLQTGRRPSEENRPVLF